MGKQLQEKIYIKIHVCGMSANERILHSFTICKKKPGRSKENQQTMHAVKEPIS